MEYCKEYHIAVATFKNKINIPIITADDNASKEYTIPWQKCSSDEI